MEPNRVFQPKLSYNNWKIFHKYDYFPMRFVDFYNQAAGQKSDLSEWFLRVNAAQRFVKRLNLRGTQTNILNDVVDRANLFNLHHDMFVTDTLPDKDGMTYLYPYDYHLLQSYRLTFRSEYYPQFAKAYYAILTKLIRREERRRDELLLELDIFEANVDETIANIARDLEEMKLYVEEIDEDTLIPDPKIFEEHYHRARLGIESLKLSLAEQIERQRIPMASTPTRRVRRARRCPDVSMIDPRTIRRDKDINVTFTAPGSPHPGVKIRIRGKMPREQSWVTRTPPPPRIDDSLIRPVVKITKTVGFPAEQHWVIRTPPPIPRDESRRFPLEQNWILRTPPPPRIDDPLIRPTVIIRQRRKFPVQQSWVIRTPPPRPADPLDGNYTIIDDHIHGLDESFPGNPNLYVGHRAEDLDLSRDPHEYIEIPELGGQRFRVREEFEDNEDRKYMMSLHRQGEYDRRVQFPLQDVQ